MSSSSPDNTTSEFETLSELIRTSSPIHNKPPSSVLNIGDARTALNENSSREDQLIKLQSLKIQLQEKRDRLIRDRSSLENELDELRIEFYELNKVILNSTYTKQVKTLLDSNTKAYIDDLEQKNKQNDDYILSSLNVLPATDWNLRLEFIKRFVPFLEIDKINTFNSLGDDRNLRRIIEFRLILPLVFKVNFQLTIVAETDFLENLEMSELFKIAMISNSFHQTLVKNYIPNKKINVIMFGLNSLSRLLQLRITAMNSIIKHFRDNLYDRDRFEHLLQDNVDNRKLFATLQNTDELELQFQVNSKTIKLILSWELILGEIATGTCQSQINLYVADLETTNSKNLSQVFQDLLVNYDVLTSLNIIIKKLF